jgi:hypothetical protein
VPDDLITVSEALAIIRRRGVSEHEWSQAVADGAVPSWAGGDGRLQVRRNDAERWSPTANDPSILDHLDDLVARHRELEHLINDEVRLLRDAGVSWFDIADALGVSERDAQVAHDLDL